MGRVENNRIVMFEKPLFRFFFMNIVSLLRVKRRIYPSKYIRPFRLKSRTTFPSDDYTEREKITYVYRKKIDVRVKTEQPQKANEIVSVKR